MKTAIGMMSSSTAPRVASVWNANDPTPTMNVTSDERKRRKVPPCPRPPVKPRHDRRDDERQVRDRVDRLGPERRVNALAIEIDRR